MSRAINIVLICLYQETIYQVKHQIFFVFLAIIKEKTPDTSIIREQPIQKTVKPKKRAKENSLTDVEKVGPKEKPLLFRNKVDYKGDTNEKTHVSEDSTTETDGCVINLPKEHKNEEDKEFKEYASEINDTNN